MDANRNLFKMGVLWTAWTPQIATRILRDVMAMQRLARVSRATLLVATDEQLVPQLTAMGVSSTSNFLETDMLRVYSERGILTDEVEDRIPEGASLEIVSLGLGPLEPSETVQEPDPYAGVEFYKDWKTIPETMPLDGKTPPRDSEPVGSPLL